MKTHPAGPTLQEGAGAALRVFFRLIVPGWTFDENEQARLLAVPAWQLAELRTAAEASDLVPLPDATLARLGFLVTIHASLTRFPRVPRACPICGARDTRHRNVRRAKRARDAALRR